MPKKKRVLEVEYVPIEDIEPYASNAKLHPAEQIEQIKKSIQEFGMLDPIAVWKNVIVEGHGRLIACSELGIKEVPIIRLDGMSNKQRKAYALAHNKLTMNSGWEHSLLDMEIESIESIMMKDYGLDLSHIEIDDLDDIFNEEEEEKKPRTCTCPYCNREVEL